MKLSAPIFKLKRRARLLSREAGILLSEALDRIAVEQGFSNWSLLARRHSEDGVAMAILSRVSGGDLVLIGARPLQGKTLLALKILAHAHKLGRPCAFFTLEYTAEQAKELLGAVGVRSGHPAVLIDTSDQISADYMIETLGAVQPGSVVLVDYLQALDQQRTKSPVAAQIATLKAFAAEKRIVIAFISQIDRGYDPIAKRLPDINDVRMPNEMDTTLFTKTCFLHEGEVMIGEASG